ncbi:MAG: SpaA isopeptide-forming pilin-related protein, partial [Eubacteriaceae bacterium]|nr:SpaA isopeptide-forming pilin-related protein [Eubacteriaceae bacterium]
NKLTASVVYKKGNATVETAAFNNKNVAPTPVKVSLNATKSVDNNTPADGETFDFKLTPGTGAPGTVQTVKNTKDAVNFDAITFDQEGTYNYTIEESGSKVGYSYDKTAYTAVVTITKNAETNQLEAAVEYKNGDDGVGAAAFNNTTVAPDATVINLSAKKTLNGGTPVAGETFKFTAHATQKPDGVTLDDQTMTNNGGAVNFNEMSASQEGTYTFEITESGTAAGYALDTNVYTATVEVTKNVLTNKLECGPVVYQNQAGQKVEAAVFNNATIYPKVTVSKTDITGEAEVAGAALSIKDKNGTVVESWTSTNTAHEVTSKLVPGETYTLHEDGAPAGYAYASDITFTVNKEGADQKVIMVDKPVDVTISKKAITGDNELPGATLSVKDKKGNIVDQWVSTNEAHKIEASKLTAGATYTLHEEGAPDGYTYASDITFTVNKDGSAQTVTMIDKAIELTISKQDITNSKELAGATLQIRDNDDNGAIVQDKNGNPLQWISGDTPKTIDTTNFKAGHVYVLVEIKAPAGYAIAESISFKIGDGDSDRGNCTIYTQAKNSETFKANDNQTVIMQDAVLPVNPTPSTPTTPTTPVEKTKSLAVSKQDITSGSELPGATLKIFDTATGKEVLDKDGNALEWISGTTPKTIDTTNMTAGDTYMLVESQAPKGYQVAESIYFKLDQPKDSDQTSYDVYIRNGSEWTLADGQTVTMKDATNPNTPTPTTPTTPTTTPTTPSTPKLTTTVVTPTTPNAGTTTTTMTTGNQNATTVSNNGNANTGVHHNGYPIAAAALCVIAAILVIAVDKRKKQH